MLPTDITRMLQLTRYKLQGFSAACSSQKGISILLENSEMKTVLKVKSSSWRGTGRGTALGLALRDSPTEVPPHLVGREGSPVALLHVAITDWHTYLHSGTGSSRSPQPQRSSYSFKALLRPTSSKR
jgi:hypothetical protein